MQSKSHEIEELQGRLQEFQTAVIHNDRIHQPLMVDIAQLFCDVLDGMHRLDKELVNFMILSPTVNLQEETKSVYSMTADEYLELPYKL